jgi:large subunit ribosomal protein L6
LSRIGKSPVEIPEKVDINISDNHITCKGPRGELSLDFHKEMQVQVDGDQIKITRPSESKSHRALHGLTRSLIANMVAGVSEGYRRKLEIVGVGYRAEMRGDNLVLNVGYSHPIVMSFPDMIKASCPSVNEIIVEGADKQLVGMIAAKIRSFRKPEPYKGKGIRYEGEYVRRKAGKTGA